MAGRISSPGGTEGGLGSFLLGFALTVGGGYLIANQARITSGYWNWFGTNTFGLTLLPLLLGIGLLFFDARSRPGWLLAAAGGVIIFAGILANLQLYFRSASLFETVLMFGLFVGGLGLMARGLLR